MKKLPVLLVLGILPFFVYPIFFGLAVLSDIAVGDRSFIFSVAYSSHRRLLVLILTDWYASLPISFIIIVFMLLPMHLVLQRLRFSSGAALLLLASLGGWLFSYLINGQDTWLTTVFIFCGAIIAGFFHAGMRGARALGAQIKP